MKKNNIEGHRILKVDAKSIAHETGIEQGDILLSINNEEICDIIDYMVYIAGEELNLLIKKQNGEEWEIEIEKEAGEELGITFEHDLLDKERSCRNNCIFCFIDQLPENMRNSLYYKDDDWRLSFLMGSYITMTNMDDHDIERIIKKNISPLYISVHTTNPELRCKMLRNKFAGDTLKYLYRLARAGIKLHCQIVLCPGWNDGIELNRTLSDLWSLHPSIISTAVVPVGLTSHRKNLQAISPYNQESASRILDIVENWQNKCRAESGTGFIYAADEFYLTAGREFPIYSSYDEFPQLENGVGLTVQFLSEFEQAIILKANTMPMYKKISVVTGVSASDIIRGLAVRIEQKYGIEVNVITIVNKFFGERVTVAGLVTGNDIKASLRSESLGEIILIPHVMLRRGEDVFLDGVSLESIEKDTGVQLKAVVVNGQAFLDAVLGIS